MNYIARAKEKVTAVEYNLPITSEVKNILDGKENLYFFNRDELILKTFLGNLTVRRGDMIIQLPSGLLTAMTKEMFHLKYEKLE